MDGTDRPSGPAWDQMDPDDDLNLPLAEALIRTVDWLVETPTERMRILDNRVLEDLYGGRWVNSDELMPGVNAYGTVAGDPIKLNFARNAVDFVHTKISAETPAVVVSSRSGRYRSERRAQLLTQYIDRLTSACDLMSVASTAALCALRTGTAVIKTTTVDGRPNIELVPSEWVHVDVGEALNGRPGSMYERRPMPRRVVLETLVGDDDPDLIDAVERAPTSRDPLDVGLSVDVESNVDTIDVYEGWTLARGKNRPGRHVICIHDAVLLDEEWNFTRFPHAFFGVDPPPPGRGFWAQGLLCHLDEAQAEIDFLLGQVSEQIRLSRLKVFVRSDSGISEDQLADSAQGTIVTYEGQAPTFSTPPTVNSDALRHIQWLVQELYQTIGMSEQASSSQRPAGVNSGRAILFFHDFQTKRYVQLVVRYGQFVIDVVDRLLDRAEELHSRVEDDLDADEKIESDDELSWAKVRLGRDSFTLQLEAISPVPRSYAGRTQRIEQLIAQGQMPEGYWTEYLSDPNAWKAEHRAAAQAEYLEWIIETLSDPDVPEPELSDKMDFGMALEVLGGEILTLIRKGAESEVIDRFEDFYDSIVARRKELQQVAAELQGRLQAGASQMGGGASSPTAPGLADMATGGLSPTNPG